MRSVPKPQSQITSQSEPGRESDRGVKTKCRRRLGRRASPGLAPPTRMSLPLPPYDVDAALAVDDVSRLPVPRMMSCFSLPAIVGAGIDPVLGAGAGVGVGAGAGGGAGAGTGTGVGAGAVAEPR